MNKNKLLDSVFYSVDNLLYAFTTKNEDTQRT